MLVEIAALAMTPKARAQIDVPPSGSTAWEFSQDDMAAETEEIYGNSTVTSQTVQIRVNVTDGAPIKLYYNANEGDPMSGTCVEISNEASGVDWNRSVTIFAGKFVYIVESGQNVGSEGWASAGS